MKEHLDYDRIIENTDQELYRFLVTVQEEATKRRARVAFPEFFSEEVTPPCVKWYDLMLRYTAVRLSDGRDREEELVETFGWFGITVEKFEFRTDGVAQADCQLLPHDFVRGRDDDYNGMTNDNNRWVIVLPTEELGTKRTEEKYLVLNVLTTGEDNGRHYFLLAVPIKHIDFSLLSSEG